jgi:uncharacterized coiled-coil DUF342 family protein
MTDEQSAQIITQLATLTESVAGLRKDGDRRDRAFEQERQDSHESRSDLHDKVNAAVNDIAAVKADIRVSAEVTAQTRETVKKLQESVDREALRVKPSIEHFDRVQKLGKVILWLLGGGFVTIIGTVMVWGDAIRVWGDAVKGAMSHWLGIK